jgi:hypothetical protein
MNIRFDYISVAAFIPPFFMVVPNWYMTLEIALGAVLVGFTIFGCLTVGIVFCNIKKTVACQYFSVERFLGWGFFILIISSMFMQGFMYLGSMYLIAALALNVLSYILMEKTA